MKKILITGGTGGVGSRLSHKLFEKGYEIIMLSRKAGIKNGIRCYEWDPGKGSIDLAAFNGVDQVINLAGSGIADHRWTVSYKQVIYNSRILSTRLLVDTISKHRLPVKTLVSTSACGYYGNQLTQTVNENTPAGEGFLAKVCNDWENEAFRFSGEGMRTVVLRLGIVLSPEAGFIPKLSKLVRLFAGSVLGSGKQLMSWIHIDDLCEIYIKALEDASMTGVYNAVAPEPVSNREVTQKLAARLHRPILLPPVPQFMLKVVLGEITESLVANVPVSDDKIRLTGFMFRYPTIDKALKDLL